MNMNFELTKEIHGTKNNLIALFNDIKNISYISGKHELLVSNILEKNGFTKEEKTLKCKDREKTINRIDEIGVMENYTFIHQPYGSQQSPDFIIKYNNYILALECKSSKQNYPTYNSGGINDYIYILSKAGGKTMIYLGTDIINDEIKGLVDEYLKEVKAITDEFNKKLKKVDKENVNYSHYHRDMVNTTANYFKHLSKDKWEKNAYKKIMEIGLL